MREAVKTDCMGDGTGGCGMQIVVWVDDDDDRQFQVIHMPDGTHQLQARDKEPKRWGKSKWG